MKRDQDYNYKYFSKIFAHTEGSLKSTYLHILDCTLALTKLINYLQIRNIIYIKYVDNVC